MAYFENRQNVLKRPETEMEHVFECMANHFSHKWIKRKEHHPLQILWNRRDALSTNELYSLGYYMEDLGAIAPKWLAE